MKTNIYILGVVVGISALTFINSPKFTWIISPGAMNTGHESLDCEQCHRDAPGSYRQQIQANIDYWTGRREHGAAFGLLRVTSQDCLSCHERPKDAHPIYRFFEPRFSKARQKIAPQSCNSCHQEHQGKRVTVNYKFCEICHEKLTLKKDPLDVSHEKLIKNNDWASCLGCHDYHGNHKQQIATKVNEVIKPITIEQYFTGSESPYSAEKLYQAKIKRDDL